MQQQWAHFLAVSAAFFAIAIIVSVSNWSHAAAAARIYGAVQTAHHDGSNPAAFFALDFTDDTVAANSGFLMSLGREAASWAHTSYHESAIWAIAILLLLVGVMVYNFWMNRA